MRLNSYGYVLNLFSPLGRQRNLMNAFMSTIGAPVYEIKLRKTWFVNTTILVNIRPWDSRNWPVCKRPVLPKTTFRGNSVKRFGQLQDNFSSVTSVERVDARDVTSQISLR